MVCTYNESLTAAKDQLRYAIGDREVEYCALSDGEIAFELAQAGSVSAAKLPAARSALRNLARAALDTTLGDISVKASQMITNFKAVIADIEAASATSSAAAPFLGGISRADVDARDADTDRVPPYFSRKAGEPLPPRSRVWP